MPLDDHKFIFIGGLQRSGTSLLYQLIGEHPLVSGLKNTGAVGDEGQNLQSVYRPGWVYGGPGKFGFFPEAHLTEVSALVSPANRLKMFSEWGKYWDLSKPFLLEKSPANLIKTRFLQALFPNSYFIIIHRHPVPNAYATKKWSRTPLYSLIKHWVLCHETFYGDKDKLKNLYIVKYEDLIQRPPRVLEAIFHFLGLEPHISRSISEVRSDGNKKYFELWDKDQKNFILRPYCKFIKDRFAKNIEKFGYSFQINDHMA